MTDIEKQSHLAEEMKADSEDIDTFVVLAGNSVAKFHDVEGRLHGGRQHLQFVHHVQGEGSPTKDIDIPIEAHLDERSFYIEPYAMDTIDEYPDKPYVLQVGVDRYSIEDVSFREEMLSDADKRETRHEK